MFEKRRSVKQKASAKLATERRYHVKARSAKVKKKLCTLLDLCVSSLRRGHANLLCIVPILTDDPRRESENTEPKSRWTTGTQLRKTPSQPKLRIFPLSRCRAFVGHLSDICRAFVGHLSGICRAFVAHLSRIWTVMTAS